MITPFKPSKNSKTAMLAIVCALNSSLAFIGHAEEVKTPEAKEIPVWKSNIELGYVSSSGNTTTTSINGAFAATYEVDAWKHAISLKSLFSSAEDADTNEDRTNAERYTLQGKTDYKMSDDGYAFAVFDYDNDRFNDNDYQTSLSLGRGYKFAFSETSNLDLEIGLGYRLTQKNVLVTDTEVFPEETITEMVARLAVNYNADITEHSKFEQKFSVEAGDQSTVSKSYTAISANIADNLALKVSLTATHQSNVREGIQALDTITAVTVVFNF